MSETKEVNIEVGFELNTKTWFVLAAATALLVGGILASVAVGVSWATYDTTMSGFGNEQTVTTHFEAFVIRDEQDSSNTEYSSGDLDPINGIDMARAGGPLLLTALILAFVTGAGLLLTSFVKVRFVRPIVAGLAAVAAILAILGVIFLPIGIADIHEDIALHNDMGGFGQIESSDLSWGGGLIVAALAGLMVLVGAVAGILSLDFGRLATARSEVDLD